MHKNLFDRCQAAIDGQFYLEAIFLEYAAIEGRLEVILGLLGTPCDKNIEGGLRHRVNISDRIRCLKKACKSLPIFEKTKLETNFFDKKSMLVQWIENRNRFVHGLYKRELEYKYRMFDAKRLADEGLIICKLLYNETKRLRRLKKSKPELFEEIDLCSTLCIKN